MNNNYTLYDILEVSQIASAEVIEKAYKTLAKKYHPDVNPVEDRETCEEYMKTLNNAYEILSNPETRQQYDEFLICNSQNTINTQDEEKVILIPKPYLWSRYFARIFDTYIIAVIIAILWGTFHSTSYEAVFEDINEYVAGLILSVLTLFVEAFLISKFATTPGKLLFGLYIYRYDGTKLSYGTALKRAFTVFATGLGFGIPLVSIFTMIYAYNIVDKKKYNGSTTWDIKYDAVVVRNVKNKYRYILSVIIILSMILGIGYYTSINENLEKEKERLNKEYNILSKMQNDLQEQYNEFVDFENKMKRWNEEGNTTEYNNNYIKYNNMYKDYNTAYDEFERRRNAYNKSSEEYNKKVNGN